MRRSLAVFSLAVSFAVIGAIPAGAATTSVDGTGSYEKLVVNNASRKLIFKIHAPGGECDIKYLAVKFRDRDGTRYEMDGGCYPGPTWAASLVKGTNLVSCSGFKLRFNEDASVWTGTIPRTCLRKLGAESWVDDYSPNINEVPATRYVKQG